jgi:hypothetical protein
MSGLIAIRPEDVPDQLRRMRGAVGAAIRRGANEGAHRARAILVTRTPTDTGHLRAAWRVVERFGGLPTVINDAPYAGVVEMGARPHPVSREGIQALVEWVWRHRMSLAGGRTGTTALVTRSGRAAAMPKKLTRHGINLVNEIRGIAFAIAWKLRHYGQKPTYFVRGSLDEVRAALAHEIAAALRRVSAGGGR